MAAYKCIKDFNFVMCTGIGTPESELLLRSLKIIRNFYLGPKNFPTEFGKRSK